MHYQLGFMALSRQTGLYRAYTRG